ncbi:MAG: hypothetical protein U1F43_16295 [Myxococcota bacterium]
MSAEQPEPIAVAPVPAAPPKPWFLTPTSPGFARMTAAVTAVVAHLALLVQAGRGLGKDWGYFDSLSLVVRSNVFGYGSFPLHNPWACGGLDLLTNPQSRVFSPLMLADLALPPQLANLFGLMLYAFIGFIGALKLLEHLGVGRVAALIGAALWINASWFGLHFAEGHIAYGPMQLLPLVFYAVMRIGSRRHLLLLAAVFAWFLLDGAIYALIFATLAIILMLLLGLVPRREWKALVAGPRWPLVVIPLAALLVALPRIYPLVANVGARAPKLETYEMPWALLRAALFDPLQTYGPFEHKPRIPWRFHEYACYVSLLGLALVLVTAVVRRGFFKASWRFVVATAFWLWVGAGWFPAVNPWKLFQQIPFANNAHIQSRVFIVMLVFFVVLVAKALDAWRSKKLVFAVLGGLLVVESAVVRIYPTTQLERDKHDAPGYDLIASTTIARTVGRTLGGPEFYLDSPDTGSAKCYEPSFTPTRIAVTDKQPPLPEASPLDTTRGSKVTLVAYTPGEIDLDYRLKRATPIVLNTNALWGWQVAEGSATLSGRGDELLQVTPADLSGHLHLTYAPPWVPWLVAAWLAGLGALVITWRRTRA